MHSHLSRYTYTLPCIFTYLSHICHYWFTANDFGEAVCQSFDVNKKQAIKLDVFVSHVSVFVDTPFWLYSGGKQQAAAALSHRRSGLVKLFWVFKITKLKEWKNKSKPHRDKLNKDVRDRCLAKSHSFTNIDRYKQTAGEQTLHRSVQPRPWITPTVLFPV